MSGPLYPIDLNVIRLLLLARLFPLVTSGRLILDSWGWVESIEWVPQPLLNTGLAKYLLIPCLGEGLVAFVNAESGRRTEHCSRSPSILWLVLNHTEVKKGRGNPKIIKLRYLLKQTSIIYTYLWAFGGVGLEDTQNFNLPINRNNRKVWNNKKQRHQRVWDWFVTNQNNKWVVRKKESEKNKGKDKHGKR